MDQIIETEVFFVIYNDERQEYLLEESTADNIMWGKALCYATRFLTTEPALKFIRESKVKASVKKVTVTVINHYI
jgi:hypothetical protein